jgi:hypothetical protein
VPVRDETHKGTQSIVTLRFGSGFTDGIGPSSGFLAKILGVDSLLFLWKTVLFSTFLTVFHVLVKCSISISSWNMQLVACLLMVRPAGQCFIPNQIFILILIAMFIMAM